MFKYIFTVLFQSSFNIFDFLLLYWVVECFMANNFVVGTLIILVGMFFSVLGEKVMEDINKRKEVK